MRNFGIRWYNMKQKKKDEKQKKTKLNYIDFRKEEWVKTTHQN